MKAKKETPEAMTAYNEATEKVYEFVFTSMEQYSKPHCYGDDIVLSMVEMHTISQIENNPRMLFSVATLAPQFSRSTKMANLEGLDVLSGKTSFQKKISENRQMRKVKRSPRIT